MEPQYDGPHRWTRIHGQPNQILTCSVCGTRSMLAPGLPGMARVHVRWTGPGTVTCRGQALVVAFQAWNGLRVDGVVGPETERAYDRLRLPETCAETVVHEVHEG